MVIPPARRQAGAADFALSVTLSSDRRSPCPKRRLGVFYVKSTDRTTFTDVHSAALQESFQKALSL